jgi:putative SOS response-associated peptidase YedK
VCGRYTLTAPDPAQVRARFGLDERIEVRPRFNIAPTDEVLAVTTDRDGRPRGEMLRWGLVPPWSRSAGDGAKMINARAETLGERPAFRGAFERFRCLIPADGFYEWRRLPGGGREAFHITRGDSDAFAFAGLWSVWRRGEPGEIRSCTIITTAANPRIAPLHDRMPVILEPSAEALWLAPGAPEPILRDLLRPLDPAQTAIRQVGPAVNSVRCDGPECLAPPPAAAQAALF